MSDKQIHLRIISPSGIVYEGEVLHATFPGETGSFAVYPHHAPLISALIKGKIQYTDLQGNKQVVNMESGFAEVSENQITACVEV